MTQPGSHTRTSPATTTAELARFALGTGDDIPREVTSKIKLHMLDTLGCQVAFAPLPWSRAVWRYARPTATAGRATIAHYGAPAPAEVAAFANASFAHGFEMDDTEMRSTTHPGAVVIPAALAAGQGVNASGIDLLRAVTVGYETMVRIGLASVGMLRRAFHTTAVTGPFGAAAAAASILSVDEPATTHSLGIAASLASGITEYSVSGGSVKRAHAGFAARSGVQAVALARAGLTAPSAALEGQRGLLQAISDHADPGLITDELGTRFELLSTGLKPYCCCAAQHSVIDAVTQLQRDVHGLTPSSIARIRVVQNRREAEVVGRTTEPADLTGAQFSAAFGIALRLVEGDNGFRSYLGSRHDDQRLLSVARKVEYSQTPAASPLPGYGPCEVSVETKGGQVHRQRVLTARGTAENPMTEAEVVAKFHSLADEPLGVRRAARLADMVANIETVSDVNEVASLLVARRGYQPPTIDIMA